MHRMLSKFCTFLALALALLVTTSSWARANEKITEFNIPPQALESALLVFASQADVQVSVSTVALVGMKTQGVVGRLKPSVALARLLEATGLAFSTIGERTFSVVPPNAVTRARPLINGLGSAPGGDEMLLLAQGTAPGKVDQSTPSSQAGADGSEARSTRRVIEEVLVTGSHIPGHRPIGASVIEIGQDDIDQQGFSTLAQAVQALPQNFGGGPNEANSPGRAGFTGNSSAGTSINLRGLGAGATLVLVNGRRLAPAGVEASFVDVSSIPLAAVERVDVLPDGASAIYGADAVGGVVNVVLRRDYDGADTRLQLSRPMDDGAQAQILGQTLGTHWASGSALLSYEYFQRDALFSRDRDVTANADLRALGGSDFRSLQGVPGTIAIGARTWAIPPGQDGTNLDPASLVEGTRSLFNSNDYTNTLPEQERHSGYLSFSQSLGDRATLLADVLYTQRAALDTGSGVPTNLRVTSANPFYVNPTGATTPIVVRYNLANDLGPIEVDLDVETVNASLGIEIPIANDWRVTAYGAYAREEIDQLQRNFVIGSALAAALLDTNPSTAFNPFGDGSANNPATLDAIRGDVSFLSKSTIKSAFATASGSILDMPGGELGLALGAEYRTQDFDTIGRPTAGSPVTTMRTGNRDIQAAFAELRVPVVGEGNARPALAKLEFSAAGRYERFSDFGSAVSPKLGLAWAPVDDFSIHGSWSTSFKPPNLPSLDESRNFTVVFPVPDSTSPSGFSDILLWGGRNADLQEETARSWAVGFQVRPSSLPEFVFDLTYFNIDFDDRIQDPPIASSLDDPTIEGFWIRNPTPEQRARACDNSIYAGADPLECMNAPIAALGDFRTQNIAQTQVRGFDLTSLYSIESRAGRFDLALSGTYLSEYRVQLLETVPWIEARNTPRNPVDLRLRGSAGWTRGGFSAGVGVNHVGDYQDTITIPNRAIGSWTTVDLRLGYSSDSNGPAWLDDASVSLNLINAFDKEPPFFNNPGGVAYDPTNADAMGRLVSVQLRKGW